MTRRFGYSIALAALLSFAFAPIHAAAADGTIEGTVKITGVASGANVVVYVQHANGTFPPSASASMDQQSMKFVPHTLPVVVGTTVKFLNNDATQHNVFSPDYEKYNLGTWPQGQTKDHVFAKCAKAPCAYVQLCRIHPEMEGYIVVLQNPFFAVTDQNGHYKIENVPPGAYTLGVWNEKGKAQPKPVTVAAGKPATVDFVLAK